jgi:hypothetical protein
MACGSPAAWGVVIRYRVCWFAGPGAAVRSGLPGVGGAFFTGWAGRRGAIFAAATVLTGMMAGGPADGGVASPAGPARRGEVSPTRVAVAGRPRAGAFARESSPNDPEGAPSTLLAISPGTAPPGFAVAEPLLPPGFAPVNGADSGCVTT